MTVFIFQAVGKEIANSKMVESDGPLYDTVASDDEYETGIDPNGDGITMDDYTDLKCQLAAAEARVGELEKRNSDVSNEVSFKNFFES